MATDSKSGPHAGKRALLAVYTEVGSAHAGLMEFRAKLLGLLPLASGTGIFFLLKEKTDTVVSEYLVAAGIFGFVVTLGLYFHELYSIRWCETLFKCGKAIEKHLFEDADISTSYGEEVRPFKISPCEFGRFVSARGAALLIYPATMGAWAYLALARSEVAISNRPWVSIVPFLVTVFFLLFGVIAVRPAKSSKGSPCSGITFEQLAVSAVVALCPIERGDSCGQSRPNRAQGCKKTCIDAED